MKNVTKFSTAFALKEAGFPQPEPAFGQIWYDEEGTAMLVFSKTGDFVTDDGTVFCAPDTLPSMVSMPGLFSHLYSAPTAADILRELPDYALAYDSESEEPYFYCFDTLRRNPSQYPTKHTNPAEACAVEYLETKKTPTGEIIAIAGERLNAGDWVSLDVDGTVKKAQPPETPVGFAGENIFAGESIVQDAKGFWNKKPQP